MSQCSLPKLTESELRLLPLLSGRLALAEIARLLGIPRDDVLAEARVIYSKLGLSPGDDSLAEG